MNPNIITTPMEINGREFVLAEVRKGMGHIGVFRYSTEAYSTTDVFYMENEPIIKVFNRCTADQYNDKHVQQISGAEKCADAIKSRISATAQNLFRYNQGLLRSAVPALELLNPGLYVIHDSQMHPCDGNGHFFWNAYFHRKEVPGTSDKNAAIDDANFAPCFLMPTLVAGSFQHKRMYELGEKLKNGRRLGGVAYHVSGMFSALLEGHHEATAALLNNVDFRCLVIEPVTDVIYDSSNQDGEEQKITALSCPYINIPINEISDKALELFLVTRKHTKPLAFPEIKNRMTKTVRITSKRAFPSIVYEIARQLPTRVMVEAASGIDSITAEQLLALLMGDVTYTITDEEGNEESKYVVSSNYDSSVVAVANFLQTNDFSSFLVFSFGLLRNIELESVHKFISERLLEVMHPSIYEFFAEIIKEGEEAEPESDFKDGIIYETAVKYAPLWEAFALKQQGDTDSYNRRREKDTKNVQAVIKAKGIATLEAAVKSIGDMPRA